MLIDELINVLEISWNKNTCIPSLQDNWNQNNKKFGQWDVTALIINDFLGGKIIKCMSGSECYYYNIVNNKIIDLYNFNGKGDIDCIKIEEATREELLSNNDIKVRYKLFLNKVKDNFVKYGTKKYILLDVNGQYFSKVPGICGGNKKLKVYGRLDCKNANYWLDRGYYKENRVFFETEEIAKKLGYRPCAKCMKKEYQKWKESNCK